MSIPIPKLDDRSFDELVNESRLLIRQKCPEWNDLSVGDPGMMLLDAFAYCTDVMLYRLNQVPEMNYIRYLRLIGVQIHPPVAANVRLTFSLKRKQDKAVAIPKGTRVTTSQPGGNSQQPVFVTVESAKIAAGETSVEVLALHSDYIEAEIVGKGTGFPGLEVSVDRPPIIASSGKNTNLVVAIETTDELDVGVAAIKHKGKTYRVWHEVQNFSNLGTNQYVYVVDRLNGKITFAPEVRVQNKDGGFDDRPHALAQIPKAGAEILVSYYRGGGSNGNVSSNTLTVLKDPIAGVDVTNESTATGGRAQESVGNALVRGPIELHSLQRVVTESDFERVAMLSSGAVEQAHAFTKASLWSFAAPGTVQVLLVPHVENKFRGKYGEVSVGVLHENETDTTLLIIKEELDKRIPFGIITEVLWTKFKTVSVSAKIVVHREEDKDAVKERLLKRLYQTINPLSSSPDDLGWPIGRALTVSDIYKIISKEPGIISAKSVRLNLDKAPDQDVATLAVDNFQKNTWYSAKDEIIFRSLNNGQGWEAIGEFKGETIILIKPYPPELGITSRHAGMLTVVTRLANNGGSRLYFTHNCGETWIEGPLTTFQIADLAWIEREGVSNLLLATKKGLFQVEAKPGAVPRQIGVDAENKTLGFVAVAVSTGAWGGTSVAVAAEQQKGIYLSNEGAIPNSFKHVGLEGENIQTLNVQRRDLNQYFWAGIGAIGDVDGSGAFRWQITGSHESGTGWMPFSRSWRGGSCRYIAFSGSSVFAATSKMGVLILDVDEQHPTWRFQGVDCGIKLADVGRLEPIERVVVNQGDKTVMATGKHGIYLSQDMGKTYEICSGGQFTDEITLPGSWLFTSGEHKIEVVNEDEA